MAFPLIPFAVFGVVVLASSAASAGRRRDLGEGAATFPEFDPHGPCRVLGTISAGGGGECMYPAPSPGEYVDLNFAWSLWQADDVEVWRWAAAGRLSQGQRLLLHAFDMAYGTQFLSLPPRQWGEWEHAVLNGVVLNPVNGNIWTTREPPEWRWRLRNVPVERGWQPGPRSDAERTRVAGSLNYPVVYLPPVEG